MAHPYKQHREMHPGRARVGKIYKGVRKADGGPVINRALKGDTEKPTKDESRYGDSYGENSTDSLARRSNPVPSFAVKGDSTQISKTSKYDFNRRIKKSYED